MAAWLCCAVLGLLAAPVQEALADDDSSASEIRSFVEILSIAEASEMTYRLELADRDELVEGAAEALWPQMSPGVENPTIDESGGEISLGSVQCSDEAKAALERAEERFARREMKAAAEEYCKALAADPRCYPARLFLGDTDLHLGRPAEALGHYEAAAEASPFDYRGHFFRATALRRLGRIEEAARAYVDALTLKPRHEPILRAVSAYGGVGLEVRDVSIDIPVRIERVSDTEIEITTDGSPHWFAYGLCKAVQIGEGEIDDHSLNTKLEKECLVVLLSVYLDAKGSAEQAVEEEAAAEAESDEAFRPEPKLELLVEVVEAGLVDGWIFYEIASRLTPQVAILLPRNFRDELRKLVERFVLVPVEDTEDAG